MMSRNPREPDTDAIASFVRALFRHAEDDTYASLRGFDQCNDAKPAVYIRGVRLAGLEPVIDAAISAARYCANTSDPAVFAPPIATFSVPNKAAEKHLANGLTISVELDAGNTDVARRRLEHLLGPATVIMASGGEWTDSDTGEVFPKIHAHWRLSEPTMTDEDHARLKHARLLACALVSADPTAKTIVHPLRWPGSWHLKGAPKLARITALDESAEVHLVDALDALESGTEDAGISAIAPAAASGEARAGIEVIESALHAIPNDDEHWDQWIKVGLLTYRASAASEAGLRAWIDWSQKSGKFVAGACEERWCHFRSSPPDRGGVGTLIRLAKAVGWRWPQSTGEVSRTARSDTAKAAFRMLRAGVASADLLQRLHTMNQQRSHPLPSHDVDATALWAAGRMGESRARG